MGHLNVGFYVAKAKEALAGLAAELGMPHAFAPHAEATLLLREQHIRFLREAHVGAALRIEAGVLEMGEDEARLLLLMRHGDGSLAASFQMLVAHVTAREGRPFPWPAWARGRAAALTIEAPEEARPRSLPLGLVETAASGARARELDLPRIGMGVVRPDECDPFGRMGPEGLMARLSDSAIHLFSPLLAHMPEGRVGMAVLDYRFVYAEWPRMGDRLEIRSGLSDAQARVRRMTHWILDPASGRAWAAAEAVAAAFDLDSRKMIALTESQLAPWRAAVTAGLAI
jgi:acyl-CoA thioester hydrolase